MCGIIGIFGKNNPKERAHKALKMITHRGSSTFEIESFSGATIGANRLPIIDREFGKQPQTNAARTTFAVQNGEIFNYRELKEDLRAKGHDFNTDSDTEVLAHLYDEYGSNMVNYIDSEMFAFVIYDRTSGAIFAARDPLGVKPLYYAKDSTGQLYFASELKQLSIFDDISTIHEFPAGHFYLNGTFTRYFDPKWTDTLKDEREVMNLLETAIVQSVKKRVQTDLPIGVFLSGGVDSSLIMEIATRLHSDVTAIILGYPGSSDHEFAVRLCEERGYKYHVVSPDVDYAAELDGLIYHLETYEPLIIRQSFSLDLCAKAAHQLGLSIVLVGEGADELFAGYNEFSGLPKELINKGCKMLVESLHSGHLQRVDRMSMKHTIEIRSPFFDRSVINLAMQISGELKVKHENHSVTTKYILRKVAENFLPDYIAWRYKVPFSNGAGMNVGSNFHREDGDVARIAKFRVTTKLPQLLLDQYSITTQEGQYYLSKFIEFGFDKLVGAEKRLVVKDNLQSKTQNSRNHRHLHEPSIVDKIIATMTSNTFRRDYPFLEDVLHQNIERAQQHNEPIRCVSFWGASSKKHVDDADRNTLQNLSNLSCKIQKVYKPGIEMTFILSDEHAKNNGYSAEDYEGYLVEIEKLLQTHGFSSIRLSTLWKQWGITTDTIQGTIDKKPNGWWNDVVIAKTLEEQASKHCKNNNTIAGAQRYYAMRMLEKPHLEQSFRGFTFVAFNNPRQQSLLPMLPTLYLYTAKRGDSRVPWF